MTSLELETMISRGATSGTSGFCGYCETLGGYLVNGNCICLNGYVSSTALFATCELFPDTHKDVFSS
jgi:hypothetical protein